jgi:hypothetical protein
MTAVYLGREYTVVNFVVDMDPYPVWVLRDDGGDVLAVDDDAEPGKEVKGQCRGCGRFTMVFAPEGPSGHAEWICTEPGCTGERPQSRAW